MRDFFSSERDLGTDEGGGPANRISLLTIARAGVPELARLRIKFSGFFMVTFQSP
jgi:hypothetical protein